MSSVNLLYFLSCPLCKSSFDRNLLLPCVVPCGNAHIVCGPCFKKTFRKPTEEEKEDARWEAGKGKYDDSDDEGDEEDDKPYTCPLCLAIVEVDEAAALPVDKFIIQAITTAELHGWANSSALVTSAEQVDNKLMKPKCENCDELNQDEATLYCIDCDRDFCNECSKYAVHAIKIYKDHKVVDIEKKPPKVPLCSQHGLPSDNFCSECQISCCILCKNETRYLLFIVM
jgi:hypothetical protein